MRVTPDSIPFGVVCHNFLFYVVIHKKSHCRSFKTLTGYRSYVQNVFFFWSRPPQIAFFFASCVIQTQLRISNNTRRFIACVDGVKKWRERQSPDAKRGTGRKKGRLQKKKKTFQCSLLHSLANAKFSLAYTHLSDLLIGNLVPRAHVTLVLRDGKTMGSGIMCFRSTFHWPNT